jgi:hypothetical protein
LLIVQEQLAHHDKKDYVEETLYQPYQEDEHCEIYNQDEQQMTSNGTNKNLMTMPV